MKLALTPVLTILSLVGPSTPAKSQSSGDTAQYEAVNDSFVLGLTEALEPRFALVRDSAPSVFLRATTRRTFNWLLPLGMFLRTSGQSLEVQLVGIPRGPLLAPPAIGPANGVIQLPLRVGAYDLFIVRPDGIRDAYKLVVTDKLIEATPVARHYTTLTPLKRWRSRRQTLSMTCTLPWKGAAVDSSYSWVCTTFAQWLQDSLGMTPFHFPGGPASPFPSASIQQWGDVLYFEYRQAVDFYRSYLLLQRFSREEMAHSAPNAYIALVNWRGAEVNSYRCRPDQSWCQPSDRFPPW